MDEISVTTYPLVQMINFDTKQVAEISGYPENIQLWINRGYKVVTPREWYDFKEQEFIANERRHARNLAKRLRRAQGKKG